MGRCAEWPYGQHYAGVEKKVGTLAFKRVCVNEEGFDRGEEEGVKRMSWTVSLRLWILNC